MKKITTYLIILLTAVLMVACGSNATDEGNEPDVEDNGDGNQVVADDNEADDNEEDESEVEPDENIEVDKGLFSVEVTIPTSFVDEEVDLTEIEAEAAEMGISAVTLNDNGSLTYKMSKQAHKNWLTETAKELDKSLKELVESDDFVSIKSIEANANYSEYTMTVDGEAFDNSFDSLAIFGIGFTGAFYQLLDGSDAEEVSVAINVVEEATGDLIDTVVFPDDLDLE